ncbi:tape measure protein [Kocuria koreensis]|uniref:Tape measure protein n=1 Tax=Rothia koreensis TaxID=592378 RepID=A0A7K1LI99_9MICC|nr:tape measure protein [Rothia koreensis]
MVAKMELASAYVTLNVSTKQMGKQIGQMFGQAESQASTTGQKMGKSIQKGLNAASTSTVEDLQKRLTSGEEKLAAATERGSRRRSAAARGVEIAEAKLNEVKEKGNAKNSQILAAENRLIKAREKYTQVSRDAVTQISGYAKEVQASKSALDELSTASTKSGGAVRAAFSGIGQKIGSAFSGAKSAASTAFSGVQSAASVAAGAVKSTFAGVGSFLKNVFTGNFSGAFNQVVTGAKTAGSAVSTAFSNVWGGFRNGLANARSSIASTAGGMVSSFTGAASSTGEAVRSGLSRGFTGIKTVASRSAAENFAAFTSGAGRAASTVGNALSGGFRATVGAARSAAANGASALTSGFSKAGSAISSGVSRSLSSLSGIAGRVGAEAGQSMTNGIMAKMKGLPAMIGGLVGLGGAGAVLSSGFNRLMDLQKSDIVFKNLGLSSKQTAGLMDSLNKAVTGTSVSLSDASKNASLLMQSGVKLGPELDASTKALTNLAAASGASATDIGTIMTQIKASGQLYAGDALQLMQRGVPVYSYLAKSMGKTTDEVKKLGSEGKISYEDFVKAVNENTGDLAKEMGQTLPAKIGILKTAFASFGAELIKPFVGPMTQAVDAITGVLKDTITPAIKQFAEWLNSGSKSAEIFKGVAIVLAVAITAAAVAFGGMAVGIMAVNAAVGIFNVLTGGILIWIGVAIAAIAGLVVGFIQMYNKVGWFHDAVDAAFKGIKDVVAVFVGWWTGTAWPAIQTGLEAIGRGFNWLWQNVIVPAWNGIVTAAQWAWDSILKPIFTAIAWMITDFVGPVFTWLWQSIIVPAWNAIVQIAQWAWENVLKPIFTDISNFVRDVVGPVFSWLWENAIKPAWDAISTAISWAWENIIKPVFGFIVEILQNVVGPVFQWLLDFVVVPVFQGIGLVILAAWEIIKGVFTVLGWIIQNVLGPVFVWLWQSVIVPAWNGIAAVITWAWNSIIKPAWDAINWFINAILVPVFNWLRGVVSAVWNGIVAVISWAWNVMILPLWNAINAFINGILVPVFNWLRAVVSAVWNGIVAVIQWAWNTIILPIWNAINAFINTILVPVFNWLRSVIVAVWNGIVAAIQWAWNVMIRPAWDAIKWFIDNILIPAFQWLGTKIKMIWDWIGSIIGSTWTWLRDSIFNPMMNFIQNNLVQAWDNTANLIRDAWDKLRDAVKKPIKFVVDEVVNPFVGAYNTVKKAWGGKDIDELKPKGWATGGYTGPGGKYDPAGIVHADEYVIKKSSRKKFEQRYPGYLDAINSTGDLPNSPKNAYAKGGNGIAAGTVPPHGPGTNVWGSMQAEASKAGKMVFKATNISGVDTESAARAWMGRSALDVKMGNGGPGVSSFINGNSGGWGFYSGNQIQVSSAVPAHRVRGVLVHEMGHALGLDHVANGDSSSVMDHMMTGGDWPHSGDYQALRELWGEPGKGVKTYENPGGGGGGSSWIVEAVRKIVDSVFNKGRDLARGKFKGNDFVEDGIGVGQTSVDGIIDWLSQLFGGGGSNDSGGESSKPAEQWRSTVIEALKRVGLPTSNDYVNAWIRQIATESGGNPNAVQGNIGDVNNASGDIAKGLVQVIGATFAAYRDPSLPNDRFNPLASLVAGMRYAKARYGVSGMLGAIGHGHGYSGGGLVQPAKLFDGGGKLEKGVQFIDHQRDKPDYVLTSEQWRAMFTIAENSASKGQGMVINGGIHGYSAEEVGREVMKEQKKRETLYA